MHIEYFTLGALGAGWRPASDKCQGFCQSSNGPVAAALLGSAQKQFSYMLQHVGSDMYKFH